RATASAEQSATTIAVPLEESHHRLEPVFGNDRTHSGVGLERIAHLPDSRDRDEPLRKLLKRRSLDDHPAGCRAFLSGRKESAAGDMFGGMAQIRIPQHNPRVLAAEFHLDFL